MIKQREIRHSFHFPHPPELIWDYLTTPELLEQWLMPNDIKPIAGHRFQFTTRPRIKFGFDGIVHCEVLEAEPFKRLSYSWKGGANGKTTLDSVVVWTLTPKDGGTELLLVHRGFQGAKNYFTYLMMNLGWAKIGKRLGARLNSAGQ